MSYVVVFIAGAFINKGITLTYVIGFVIGALIFRAMKDPKSSGRNKPVNSSSSYQNSYTPPHRPESHGNTSPDTTCIYCGSSFYGHGCTDSPTGYHKHNADEDHCEDCGSVFYGHGCNYNETGYHKHGIGGNKCRWCGSTHIGHGCSFSPSGYHER